MDLQFTGVFTELTQSVVSNLADNAPVVPGDLLVVATDGMDGNQVGRIVLLRRLSVSPTTQRALPFHDQTRYSTSWHRFTATPTD